MSKLAVLSSPILIGSDLIARQRVISLSKAKAMIASPYMDVGVFTNHATIRLLGLEPDKTRKECSYYDVALVVVPNQRLEFGREYSVEEVEKIGYSIKMIEIL